MVLISKCCVGIKCRYNGKGFLRKIAELQGLKDDFLAVCPETLGGLSVPREGCDVEEKGRVRVVGQKTKRDFTKEYTLGAKKTLELCKANNITKAFMLKGSPSCGAGYGLTAKLLEKKWH